MNWTLWLGQTTISCFWMKCHLIIVEWSVKASIALKAPSFLFEENLSVSQEWVCYILWHGIFETSWLKEHLIDWSSLSILDNWLLLSLSNFETIIVEKYIGNMDTYLSIVLILESLSKRSHSEAFNSPTELHWINTSGVRRVDVLALCPLKFLTHGSI